MQPSQNTRSSKARYQRLDVADPDQADMDPSSLKERITIEQDDSSASAPQTRGGLNFSHRQPRSTNRSNAFGGRMNREGDLEEEPDQAQQPPLQPSLTETEQMNAQSKIASQTPGDIRMQARAQSQGRATRSDPDSDPTAAEHSHVGMDTGYRNTSAVDDEEDDREEDENPHLPPLREYLKMTEERKQE
ncbi:hypothetical protein BDW60DRAFT_211710 [Aspergillus nidulans var. acristatus]